MTIFEPQAKPSRELLVPMINVVLLLLIFFMLAGRLTTEDALRVVPPESTTTALHEVDAALLLIDRQGRFAFADTAVTTVDVGAMVSDYFAGRDKPWAVTIKADGATKAAVVLDAVEALREIDVDQVDLMVHATDNQ